MKDGYEFCLHCKESTWMKVTEYKRENADGVLIQTFIKDGNCGICGRKIYAVKVIGVEDEGVRE